MPFFFFPFFFYVGSTVLLVRACIYTSIPFDNVALDEGQRPCMLHHLAVRSSDCRIKTASTILVHTKISDGQKWSLVSSLAAYISRYVLFVTSKRQNNANLGVLEVGEVR